MIHRFHHGPQPWHDALYAAIRAEQAARPGWKLGVSRGASWSGPKRFHEHPAAEGLLALLRIALRDVAGPGTPDLVLWPNVTHRGGSCGVHDHANGSNVWSGCYYLTEGAPIVFPARGLTIEPEPGLLLLFAAAEPHRVSRQISAAPRVSVAMNAT